MKWNYTNMENNTLIDRTVSCTDKVNFKDGLVSSLVFWSRCGNFSANFLDFLVCKRETELELVGVLPITQL